MNKHIAKLTEIQKHYAVEVAAVDTDLSPEGEAKRVQRVRDKYRAELEKAQQELDYDVNMSRTSVSAVTPKPSGDTSAAWQRVQMLLDAGQSLSDVVAQADAATLHALTEWGPTWVQARASKAQGTSLSAAINKTPADTAPLLNSIRNRWADLVGGSSAETLKRALTVEAARAQFNVTAAHLSQKFAGVDNSGQDMEQALEAHYAGQATATLLGGTDDAEKEGEAA